MNKPTDAEFTALARGLMYDTATMMEDLARRYPALSFQLYVEADTIRGMADCLGAISTSNASATPEPTEPTAGRESLQPDR